MIELSTLTPGADRLPRGKAQASSGTGGGASRTILFLDYDGVLHPNEVYLERGRPVLRGEGELFMWLPPLIDLLRSYPYVQIVLSTSWSRVFGFERAKRALPVPLIDRALCAISEAIRQTLREYDVCGRWGGEEFLVLLPETSAEFAIQVTERVRSSIEQVRIDLPQAESLPITASFGLTQY